ncbi:CocE/NonD family hydrolase [Streptomyces sp. ADI96-02]|uniref:CocE/NonD family hydrolase n=1 Tax=Streptomyces sp. ADI96-02 TaxID=1522760 RepID=UPI000F54FFF6|nr:CocE/NonD family hydrolase [Streptomyces sp. ADI96-02]
MRIITEFPYETSHEDVRIPLPDGTRLYARVWRPLTDEPVPALLEYLPYRLGDGTAPRDRQRHPWYAGHGYASVRVDIRGHGNSEGLPGDPYDATELEDGVAVIHWLARQEWCSGRVGMFGISWGGFTSLRIAALAPEPLKAIVTVCSTDDRYDNDVHYMGGSVLAVDMHAWAATLLALTARPPDPAHVGEEWKEMWVERLEAVTPFVHTWLAHQTRDAYWKHGSVREDYGAIKAKVLAVGGWHDPYRDSVLRLVEHLDPRQVRGLIGPWSHQYPDRGLPPGPAIGFLQETLRWWDQHLKNTDTGVMREPLLRSWISGSHPPATAYETLPGRWVGDASRPPENVAPVSYALQGGERIVASPQQTGVDAGRFMPCGGDADLPPDQRDEDARSVSFEFPVAGEPIEILGRPRVRLRVRMDAPRGQVIARLCDVAPDGSSTLVTRGALNLSARHGSERADDWIPGATEDIAFDLNGIGHTFPPGHRIRLAVSSAYWPWIWPQAGSAGFVLDAAGGFVELPVRRHTEDPGITFGEPEQSEPLGVVHPVTLDERRPERLVVRDVAKGEWRTEVVPRHGGTRVHPDGLEITEDALETYTVQERDPLSARTRSDWTIRLHRPEMSWDVRIETRSEIAADAHDFITSDEVVCKDGDEIVFHRTWEKRVPRTAG